MKPISGIIIGVLALLCVGAAGYWSGTRTVVQVPVAPAPTAAVKTERKILYYRNPMGLQDISSVPKKDAMGMEYVAVYEGGDEPGSGNQLKISVEKVQKLGVRTEVASIRALDKTVRTVGRVEINERHIYNIAPKFEGWIEKLYVNTTGDFVREGQLLFDVYSPELVSAQREYVIAAQGVASLKDADGDTRRGMQQLADASLLRLKNWEISGQQVQDLAKSGAAKRTLAFHSPVNGVVLEKKALQGARFMPGEMLYQIAGLSSVWVMADVFEQDIALVKTGTMAKVRVNAYPGKEFEGAVTYIYPTLKPETRTVPVRLEIANPQGLLKPAMFAQVEIPVTGKGKVLTVPSSAVIDSGTRQIVLVQLAEGRFEPREARLGSRSDNYVEVLEGVAEGEQVVVAANFLIDAESNLKAALGGLGHAHDAGAEGAKEAMEQGKPATVGHQAEGMLDAVDSKAGSVTITHGPIKTLGWPGMTMDFALANPSLVSNIKIGSAITFEIVERKPGEWVITKLQAKQAAPSSNPHAGH